MLNREIGINKIAYTLLGVIPTLMFPCFPSGSRCQHSELTVVYRVERVTSDN